ncbi:MAG TPA: efflux RND transporter periplasmic adaptor subunit [Tepidisphaeraceae bacterium]
MRRWITRLIILAIVVGVGLGATAWYRKHNEVPTSFRTTAVRKADLLATISATGTVEPEEVVDVGAQVAGLITNFGKDVDGKTIDYGSRVDEGTILANVDDSLYRATLESSQAAVDSAKAGVARAEADLEQMRAKLVEAQHDWDRAQKLGPSEALAQQAYDQYEAAYATAKANVDIDIAAVAQAKAAVISAQANLDSAKKNLGYCVITSPVKGVIIDRRVNTGQTVVSSLSTPSLFLIAKDLSRMQVWVAVNEADIGHVYANQPITFTVDAFPGETFKGTVGKVRLNAMMTQNVVTYTVEITTDNSNNKLLPYLTANVNFETGRSSPNSLVVPNSALRWQPDPAMIAPDVPQDQIALAEQGSESRAPRQWQGPPSGAAPGGAAGGQNAHPGQWQHRSTTQPASDHPTHGIVWVQDAKSVRPVHLTLGITDGIDTEVKAVTSGELADGTNVVTGVEHGDAAETTTNPFAPQFGRRR